FLSVPSRDLRVELSPHSLNLKSYFRNEWICFELAALLSLCALSNIPLSFSYASLLLTSAIVVASYGDDT
ncbi:hypothetical protein, partial [Actinobacillus pleuropneumoniae]|uniref:hypothetical protein n=1 Tax=Actinobacillus pleuropneumoniae TaxID=715 RepID=UPI00227C7D8E